jgi:UDP-N-acetylmuramate dehydrogenase
VLTAGRERVTTTPAFEIQRDHALAPLTSLAVGGPAQFFARALSEPAVPEALEWAASRDLPVTLLGGGSNVVVADAGVPGLVLTIGLKDESHRFEGDAVDVTIGAGAGWDAFVEESVERGWAGLECLSGIPGQVGATPIQNVGAYGQEVADTLVEVHAFDRDCAARVVLPRAACGFGYRTSRFKETDADRFIVLGATFRLRVGGEACLAYPEIARRFADRAPGLREVRAAVLATRKSKSMLIDPLDENGRSCGSFFLNPRLTAEEMDGLRARTAGAPPAFPDGSGRVKVPAAWLIEAAGFQRGQRWGSVGISSRHSLALVCHPGATAAAIVEAAHRVRDGVARAFGVWLSPEPRFLGFGAVPDGLPALGSL